MVTESCACLLLSLNEQYFHFEDLITLLGLFKEMRKTKMSHSAYCIRNAYVHT